MDSLLGRESVVLFPIELHCGGWELTKKAVRSRRLDGAKGIRRFHVENKPEG